MYKKRFGIIKYLVGLTVGEEKRWHQCKPSCLICKDVYRKEAVRVICPCITYLKWNRFLSNKANSENGFPRILHHFKNFVIFFELILHNLLK